MLSVCFHIFFADCRLIVSGKTNPEQHNNTAYNIWFYSLVIHTLNELVPSTGALVLGYYIHGVLNNADTDCSTNVRAIIYNNVNALRPRAKVVTSHCPAVWPWPGPGRLFASSYITRARDLANPRPLGNSEGQTHDVISMWLRSDLSHQVVQQSESELAKTVLVSWCTISYIILEQRQLRKWSCFCAIIEL